jgi:hypothetical protein
MITDIRPDVALPAPGELAVARDHLTAAIAAARADGSALVAPPRRRAWRRPQRPIALLTVGAAGAAVAAAAAVLVATAGPGHAARRAITPLPPRTASYVLSHAEGALTSAERRNLIQEVREVGQGASFSLGAPGPGRTANAPRAVIWIHRGLTRTEGVSVSGTPVFDNIFKLTYSRSRAAMSSRTVNYTARTWWQYHMRIGGHVGPIWSLPQSCPGASLPSPGGSPGDNWPAQIRLGLRCGMYRVAGTGWIDGVRAIEIVPRYRRPPHGVHYISQTVWVSRSTYLPVRVSWSWPRGHGLPEGSLTGDFTWLAPTRANLASLQVRIPHGYRQLPSGGIGGADVNFAPMHVRVVEPLG